MYFICRPTAVCVECFSVIYVVYFINLFLKLYFKAIVNASKLRSPACGHAKKKLFTCVSYAEACN